MVVNFHPSACFVGKVPASYPPLSAPLDTVMDAIWATFDHQDCLDMRRGQEEQELPSIQHPKDTLSVH